MKQNFFQKLLFAYAPLFGKDKAEKKELRRIMNRLKKNDRELIDPVQLKLKPLFGEIVDELSHISERLRNLFKGNLESPDQELMSFELKLCSTLLEKGNLSMEQLELKEILKSAHGQGQGGINTVDRIFKSRIKYFSHKNFKAIRNLLERDAVYAALSYYDYENLAGHIPRNKQGKFGSASAESLLECLKSLLFIVRALPDKKGVAINDPVIQAAHEELAEEEYSLEKIQNDLHRLYDIFSGPLSASFLSDVISLVSRSPQADDKSLEVRFDFPKEIYDDLVEKYRIDREKFISMENEKVLQSRMNSLFKDRHLAEMQIYNRDNSNLFSEAGLPALKYVIPMKIIKSFNSFFYSPVILSTLQEFQVESEFFNKKQKSEFQTMVETYESVLTKVKKFEEDLTIPSFSELLPFIDALREAFLDNKAKHKGREAIRQVNGRADQLIQATFASAINLHGYLTNINVDLKAATPKLLSNTLFMNNNKEDLCSSLEEAGDYFNRFIKLLKIFAVHVDQARHSMKEAELKETLFSE